jgi:hypothetical protein
MAELDASIREKIGDSVSDAAVDPTLAALLPPVPEELFFLEEDVEFEPFEHDDADMLGASSHYTQEAYDRQMIVVFAHSK